MGMDADLMVIGPFHPTLAAHLAYRSDHYINVPDGTLVTTELFSCQTTNLSEELAEAVGAKPWDFRTHHVNNNPINWQALRDLSPRLFTDGDHVQALQLFLRHGFTILYRPNG